MRVFGVFLILLALMSSSCQRTPTVKVTDLESMEKLYRYFDNQGVDYLRSENILHLQSDTSTVQSLISVLDCLSLEMELVADNIANAGTTRTFLDSVYRRKVLVFDDSGAPLVLEDYDSPLQLVYDPTHPDAQVDGERKGYVEYPNVNVAAETAHLMELQRNFDLVSLILQTMEPDLIIPR